MGERRSDRLETLLLHAAGDKDPYTGALSTPIYSASTYGQADIDRRQPYDYGRSGNPTRGAAESLLAAAEGGAWGGAFASGMAAISAALMAFLKAGDHVVAAKDLYGGTYRFLTSFLNRFAVTHTFVDTSDPAAVERAITPATRVLFLESPSNPLLKVTDLEGMVAIARKHNLLTMIDNTFMSPYLMRPLEWGIDISIHSATKFLGGHSDLIAGAVVTRTAEQGEAVRFVQNSCGAVLSPENSWLLIRGIKTLAVRMEQQQRGAQQIAEWLRDQPWVTRVLYPGLADHPGREILLRQADGAGAVLSFEVDTEERLKRLLKGVELTTVAVSLGGVESILSYPARMSHAAIPAAERKALGISDRLVRLSVGLEHPADLIADLARAVGGTP